MDIKTQLWVVLGTIVVIGVYVLTILNEIANRLATLPDEIERARLGMTPQQYAEFAADREATQRRIKYGV